MSTLVVSRVPRVAWALALLLLASSSEGQTAYHLTPQDDWLSVVDGEGLSPGDTVFLGAGTYVTPDAVMLDIAHVGTAAAPIVIQAEPGEVPVITRNTFGEYDDYYQNLEHNVINMRGAQHVVLDGLEITGGNWGIRIGSKTDGVNPTPELPMGGIVRRAHHITVRNCHIHHTHNTAISANFPGDVYEGLVFLNNEIHHAARWGEGLYLGNYSSGGETWAIVKNSVVQGNHIHDNVWVNSWYQDPNAPTYHGTAIQLKDGCYGNLIRDNVVHYTRYPGVLISGAESGFGARGAPDWSPNVVEGNVVWQISRAPNDITGQGMQIAADAIVRNNVVYAPQPFFNSNHQCLAGNLELIANTFVTSTAAQRDTLRIDDPPAGPITIANNALHRGEGRTDVISGAGSTNLLVTRSGNAAVVDLDAGFANPTGLDFRPVPGSPLLGVANPADRPFDDFDRTERGGDVTAGAYAYDPSAAPVWPVGPGFKALPSRGEIAGHPRLLSSTEGGVHEVRLELGPALAGCTYWVMGSMGGTAPGFSLQGVHVPLVLDPYLRWTARRRNSELLLGTLGRLDTTGRADAFLRLPQGLASLAGRTLHHAAVVFDPVTRTIHDVTGAVPLALTP